jgi:hypothetical protein
VRDGVVEDPLDENFLSSAQQGRLQTGSDSVPFFRLGAAAHDDF